jgi:hypothetical protein
MLLLLPARCCPGIAEKPGVAVAWLSPQLPVAMCLSGGPVTHPTAHPRGCCYSCRWLLLVLPLVHGCLHVAHAAAPPQLSTHLVYTHTHACTWCDGWGEDKPVCCRMGTAPGTAPGRLLCETGTPSSKSFPLLHGSNWHTLLSCLHATSGFQCSHDQTSPYVRLVCAAPPSCCCWGTDVHTGPGCINREAPTTTPNDPHSEAVLLLVNGYQATPPSRKAPPHNPPQG